MPSTRISILFSSLLGMLGIALLTQALRIKPVWHEPMGPDIYPTVVSALIVAAAFYNLVVDARGWQKRHPVDEEPAGNASKDGSAWKTPLAVGGLGVLYVGGLSLLGFFVSTFLFTLVTMGILHHFEKREHLGRRLFAVYLPLSIAIVAVLFMGIKVLRIYVPTQALLW